MRSKLTKLFTLLTILTLGISNVWADEIFGFTVTSSTTAKNTYTATGGTAECKGSAMSTGGTNEITVGTQTFYKFNSSSEWVFTLSSGTFAAGDVISFTCACTTSNKTGKGVKINNSISVTGDFPASTANTISYTVVASDGIDGESSFSIKRNDSDIKFGTVSVTRAGGGTPVCPSGLSITSKNDKTAFLEGDAIELTAALTAGNGAITYQWYKGGTAEGNKLTGKTAAKLEIASCVEGDAGDYYCVASKSDCSDAVNADAFTITVAHNPCATHHWFVATADATANGKTNWDGFTNAVTGSSGQSNSVTIDGTTYNLTKRTGSTGAGGTILGFTIPANKAGTLYGYMKSSGSAARILSLKKGDDVVKTNTEIVDGAWTLITIDAIAPGTYTLSPDQNVQVQMFVLKICDATFRTITLEYADGETADGSLSALDGAPATKPADPTWAHHRFDGWYNGATPYDWTANVTGDLTLTAHWTQLYTISFANGGGSGDAPAAIADKAQGETFQVPANTFTAPSASQEFDIWNDGTNDYAPGATYTVGTENVILTAQWKALVAKYTVIFKDGETTLDTKLVDVGSNPSDAGVDKTKALSTFAAWQKDAADIALDDAFWATVAANAEITLTARWTKAYATDVDFETEAVGHAGDEDYAKSIVDAHNYALSTKTGTTFDENTSTNNGAYLGLKIKNAGTTLSWNVVAGKVVELKAGVMVANGSLSINGGAATTIDGGSTSSGDNFLTHYFYSATEALYVFTTSNGSAEVIKAITMRDPYTVSFDVNGGDDPIADMTAMPSITLPTPTKGSESFLGWFDALDNFIGNAGDTYAPEATIELVAHWESISTDARLSEITFSAAGTLSPAFDPEVVNYTYTMPYGTAAVPTITGATAVNANAQAPVIDAQAAAWNETAIIRGVAQSGDSKAYNITMKMAPKDGVCLVWADATGNNTMTVDAGKSLLTATAGAASTKNTSEYGGKTGYKLNSRPANMHITLDGTETFQAGDVVEVFVTTVTDDYMRVFDANDVADEHKLAEGDVKMVQGANRLVLPATSTASLYLVRGAEGYAYDMWNPFVAYIAVYRPMNPILTAITINGEAGVINESLKTVTLELQPGYDLAALTIVPTIVSNTDEALVVKTVESNGGAWVLGPNTYRLTDKDGDYTEYTITLTAGALKHNVTFNTHGGSAVAGVEVVDGEYLTAGQVPANPTKEDYIFQYWSETEDGSEVDITTVQINADKEFHAVWASDGAIKLLDGSTVNHTNFITGVTADETVEFKGNTVNYAKFSGAVSGVNGVKDLTRVIAYNATTNKTKIQISAHNNSTSGRNILVKGLVEGADAADDLATIALGNKEDKVSDWIEFDNAANRTIYIMVSSSAGDVYFTQVKVIESGETPMKHAGEAGYSLNLNKGRFFGLASTDLAFEGLNARLSGDYTALNSGYAKLTSTSMSFTVASPVLLTVTTNNNKTYYVTEGAAGTDNETAKTGASEFNLTAGTWFITGGTSEVQITNIAFSAPKCEQPDVTDMVDVDLCEGDAFTALAVTANVSDGGTLHYQWYKHPAVGDDEAVGIDAATYTPDADGQYYVVVTNQLSGFGDNSKTSNTITVEHFAAAVITAAPENQRDNVGETVTLSVTASGKNLSYEWFTCDDESGTNPVAIVPAETNASLSVTVAAGTQWYKVVVSSDCGNAEAVAKVSEFTAATPQDVTATTTWDWTTDAWPASGTIEFANQTDEQLLADVDAAVPNNAAFHSDMLYGIGQYVWRSGNKFFQGKQIRFNNTVAGRVRVHFRSTGGGKNVQVTINGTVAGSGDAWQWTNYVYVPAGGVTIVCAGMTGNETGLTRIDKIEFQTPDYTRTEMLGNGVLGTLCVDHNVPVEGIQGATFYELAGKNAEGKIAFDQITTGQLDAGKPYVFKANGDKLALYYGTETEAAPVNGNGMYGTFSQLVLSGSDLNDVYYFAQTALWSCTDLIANSQSLTIPANRAYVKLSELPDATPAPAPGRIRMTLNVNGAPQVVTGVENLENNEAPVKMLINGQLFIMRGEKLYDATGRLVK